MKKTYYWLSAIVLILGIGFSIYLLITSIFNADDHIKRVIIPIQNEVYLEKDKEYTIYHEYKAIVNGMYHSRNEEIKDAKFQMTNKDTDEKMLFDSTKMKSSYKIGDREGVSLMKVHIKKSGTYTVTIESNGLSEDHPIVLTFEEGIFFGGIFFKIISAIGITVITLFISAILMVMGLKKRE